MASATFSMIRGNIMVSISARHAEDPGSILGRGVVLTRSAFAINIYIYVHVTEEIFTTWPRVANAWG